MKMTKGGFDILRKSFGSLTQSQVNEINFIVGEFDKDKTITYPQASYMLATVWHETAKTMLPIEEYGKGRGRKYGNKVDIDGKPYTGLNHIYYGRGYVQLTWLTNYVKARSKLGYDFVNDPSLAMRKDLAVKILVTGMKEGWFTGKKLTSYINSTNTDYIGARRIINGVDKAQKIANEAVVFERALRSL